MRWKGAVTGLTDDCTYDLTDLSWSDFSIGFMENKPILFMLWLEENRG